jgi:hypothetical protein
MQYNIHTCLKLALISLTLLLISCTVKQPLVIPATEHQIPLPQTLTIHTEQNHFWWYARFKFVWDGNEKTVDFSKNLIIAHQLINPVLRAHNENITLWRFHRRAGNDDSGHQFSFIFYSTPETARQIFTQIKNHKLTNQLIEHKVIEQIKLDNPDIPKRPHIEDTSDKSWSKNLQKSWPYYIMGVSIMWLELLNHEVDGEKLASFPTISAQMGYYQSVNASLTRLWKKQGEHAFYHHINAIFGYEPMEIRF